MALGPAMLLRDILDDLESYLISAIIDGAELSLDFTPQYDLRETLQKSPVLYFI